MADELIVVERADALKAFNDDKAFEELFLAIKGKADEFEADITNAKGRKELKSFCFKIRKTKARIDEVRTDITEEMRKTISEINARGKVMVERLESLHDDCRKPLTDWEEAEKIRVETIREVIDNARALGQVKFGETSVQIQERINGLPTNDLDWYGEFKDEAQLVLEAAFNSLTLAKTAAQNAEREAAEMARQRAELEALRQAEADRQAKEAAAEASRLAEQEAREKEAREAEQKIAAERAAIEAERAAMEAERLEMKRRMEEAEQASRDAAERAEAAAQAERDRIEQERIEAERRAAEEEAAAAEAAEKEAAAAKAAEEARVRAENLAAALAERRHDDECAAVERIAEDLWTAWTLHCTGDVSRVKLQKIARVIADGGVRHVRFEV